MSFVFPKDFQEVWDTLITAIKAHTIFTGGDVIQAQYTYFNTQPELRNPKDKSRFPGIVLTTMRPLESSDWRVQEGVKCLVDVTAEAPYLEGIKVPSIALADGQTLQLKRGFLNGTVRDEETLTAIFNTASFVDISQATPAEIAAVLNGLVGVSSFVSTGNTVRILHDELGSASTLQVVGGTATNLISTFPVYEVVGRDQGKEVQARRPASHYDFPFQLATLAKRPDDHFILTKFVEQLFREQLSPNERSLLISTRKFEVTRSSPVDDPLVSRGEFVTTYPFALRRVPMVWDVELFDGDNYNGGNYDGTGINPRNQTPVVAEFEFNLDAKAPQESL